MPPKFLTAINVLLVTTACSNEPQYVPSTCDFLAQPQRYEGQSVILVGSVKKKKDQGYIFEAACVATRLSIRLLLRKNASIRQGHILGDKNDQFLGIGKVEGKIKRRSKDNVIIWVIEANDFGPLNFLL